MTLCPQMKNLFLVSRMRILRTSRKNLNSENYCMGNFPNLSLQPFIESPSIKNAKFNRPYFDNEEVKLEEDSFRDNESTRVYIGVAIFFSRYLLTILIHMTFISLGGV